MVATATPGWVASFCFRCQHFVTSHACHGVSNQRQLNGLLVQANNEENINVPHYWLFVSGSHRWPMDFPHNGPVMRKTFSWYDVFLIFLLASIMMKSRESDSCITDHLCEVEVGAQVNGEAELVCLYCWIQPNSGLDGEIDQFTMSMLLPNQNKATSIRDCELTHCGAF